ncbi:MAG: Fe-S protein assembly co-chaperone HscB [Rickettsiales bacterium]|nr:Fe-S protein assembly co-chaperone HscB [Rickettsiales bacterium]
MKNYFAQFSFPIDFTVDEIELEKKYLEFQKQFHPDSASTRDIEQSIAINQAYQILKNPITRASHILQLNGIDLEDDSKALKPDLATLEEILELQEKVAEIKADEIAILQKNLKNKIEFLLQEVRAKLENKDFTKAAQILIKAKYFDKTLRDLKAKNT